MSEDRGRYADQILEAIRYGDLPREEIEKILNRMIEEELSGPIDSEYDTVRLELCNSLLWQLQTHGEISFSDDEAENKAAIAKRYQSRRHRRKILKLGLTSVAMAFVLIIALTATNLISPIRWFTGTSTEDEQQYIVQGHEIRIPSMPGAVAEQSKGNEQPPIETPNDQQGTQQEQKSLSTEDMGELIAFLGFDPGLPQTVAGVYTSNTFTSLINDSNTAISCYYIKDGHAIEDPDVKITIRYFSDVNNAYLSIQQSEEGEMISIGGIDVYRYWNYDRYGYTWTQENQVFLLVTKEQPEIAEAFLEDFMQQRTASQEQVQSSSPRTLQTSDPAEMTAFLSFDPGFPRTVAGVYRIARNEALVIERRTTVLCEYTKDGLPAEEAIVTILYFADMNDAYVSLEQSEEGEMIYICGIEIYRYRNIDRYGYTWTQENQVCTFSSTEPPEVAEVFLEDFLRQRNAALAQAPNTGTRNLETTELPRDLTIDDVEQSGQSELSTTEYSDVIRFLGFDPLVPMMINNVFLPKQYFILVSSQHIRIVCHYQDDISQSKVVFRKTIYNDVGQARMSYEQDKTGEYITGEGVSIYKYTNSGRTNYLWIEDNTVYLLTFYDTVGIDLNTVHDIIKRRD